MRWGRLVSVSAFPLPSSLMPGWRCAAHVVWGPRAALALVMLMVFCAVSRAEDPKTPPIDWTPGSKLDWSQFKGGQPKNPKFDAETTSYLKVTFDCATGKVEAFAQFSPDHSTVDPAKQSPELLATSRFISTSRKSTPLR